MAKKQRLSWDEKNPDWKFHVHGKDTGEAMGGWFKTHYREESGAAIWALRLWDHCFAFKDVYSPSAAVH